MQQINLFRYLSSLDFVVSLANKTETRLHSVIVVVLVYTHRQQTTDALYSIVIGRFIFGCDSFNDR